MGMQGKAHIMSSRSFGMCVVIFDLKKQVLHVLEEIKSGLSSCEFVLPHCPSSLKYNTKNLC